MGHIKENKEILFDASRDIGLQINAEKTKYLYDHVSSSEFRTEQEYKDS
jgi:hypothetical protein